MPNPLLYGLHPDFLYGTENPGASGVVHVTAQTDGNNMQEQHEVVQENNSPISVQGDEELQDEYMRQYYPTPGAVPVINPAPFQDMTAQKMCKDLAEQMKELKGKNSTSMSALEMCLVPDVVIPPKFKVPDFEKYKGLNCLGNHLKM